MSGRITEASAARMERRMEFIDLTPGPYLTVEYGQNNPILDISLTGAQSYEPARLLAEAIAAAVRELVASDAWVGMGYAVHQRRTA